MVESLIRPDYWLCTNDDLLLSKNINDGAQPGGLPPPPPPNRNLFQFALSFWEKIPLLNFSVHKKIENPHEKSLATPLLKVYHTYHAPHAIKKIEKSLKSLNEKSTRNLSHGIHFNNNKKDLLELIIPPKIDRYIKSSWCGIKFIQVTKYTH